MNGAQNYPGLVHRSALCLPLLAVCCWKGSRGACLQLFSAVTGAGSGTTLIVVMTELTGLYAISSIMLIRKQLPQRYRQACCIPEVSLHHGQALT